MFSGFGKIIKIVLITSLLSGCMSIPSNRVKLNKLPKAVSVNDFKVTVLYESDLDSKFNYKLTSMYDKQNLMFFKARIPSKK